MNIIKRHRGLAIVGGLSLILLIIILIIFSRMFFSKNKSEYGDRLNNLEKIEKKVFDEVKEETKKTEGVKNITIRTQGKIVYTTITVDEKTTKDKAKEIAAKTLEKYSEEAINTYDFCFFVTQDKILDEEGNDKSYTISGTKHPDKENISWTKN